MSLLSQQASRLLLSDHRHLLLRQRPQLFQRVLQYGRPPSPTFLHRRGALREGAGNVCQRWSHREDAYRMRLSLADDDVNVKLKALLVK